MMAQQRQILQFLGSMRFAIALLLLLAVASVIGTILKQNQPFVDYIVKFGPFWQRFFEILWLYDVYAAPWFLLIIAVLLSSIGICLSRNVPRILHQIFDYREKMPEQALRRLTNHSEFIRQQSPQETQKVLQQYLQQQNYRVRSQPLRLQAIKGSSNRLGYIFTHCSIIIICIGGFADSNALLKLKLFTGALTVETRDIPVTQVPATSRLPVTHPAFRSSVLIPEGKRSNYSFININSGYLLQSLPFTVELREFRIEYYNSGQPRSFESDLVIHDSESKRSSNHTISVNHPLRYHGYTIYQSSFADGGSIIQMRLHDLLGNDLPIEEITATVDGEALAIITAQGEYQLELTDFRAANVRPAENEANKFHDNGPSLQFKLRDDSGVAIELENYLFPVRMEDKYWFLSGIRTAVSEDFRYLYLPADEDLTLQRFLYFHQAVYDDDVLRTVIQQMLDNSANEVLFPLYQNDININELMLQFVLRFRAQGFTHIENFVQQKVPEQQQKETITNYLRLLQNILFGIYSQAMKDNGMPMDDQNNSSFFSDAVTALAALPAYKAPLFVEVLDYEHREASGLQINKTPGAIWVYAGFVLLLGGLFCQFFLVHQRLWIILQPAGEHTRVLFSGSRTRHHQAAFRKEFQDLCKLLQQ